MKRRGWYIPDRCTQRIHEFDDFKWKISIFCIKSLSSSFLKLKDKEDKKKTNKTLFYNCIWSRKKVIEKVLRVFWSDDGKLYFYFMFEEMSIELYLILKSLFTLEQSD